MPILLWNIINTFLLGNKCIPANTPEAIEGEYYPLHDNIHGSYVECGDVQLAVYTGNVNNSYAHINYVSSVAIQFTCDSTMVYIMCNYMCVLQRRIPYYKWVIIPRTQTDQFQVMLLAHVFIGLGWGR